MLRIVVSTILICSFSLAAKADYSPNVKAAIDLLVTLCVAGGKEQKVEFVGGAGAELSLRKFDATGNIQAEVQIAKSQAQGLVDGLNATLNEYSSRQASEARECMKPYINRILNLILGDATSAVSPEPRYYMVDDGGKVMVEHGAFGGSSECVSAIADLRSPRFLGYIPAGNCVRMQHAWCHTYEDPSYGYKVQKQCHTTEKECESARDYHKNPNRRFGSTKIYVTTDCEQVAGAQLAEY